MKSSKQSTTRNTTRKEGRGRGLNVVFLVVGRTEVAERKSERLPLRIALGLVSFRLLCSFLSAGQLHLSLWTLSSWVWGCSSLFYLCHWRIVWHETRHSKVFDFVQ